jgi:hypothetical protein
MDTRHGSRCDIRIAEANRFAEREVALQMMADRIDGPEHVTVGANKGHDTRGFVAGRRALDIAPHVAHRATRREAPR